MLLLSTQFNAGQQSLIDAPLDTKVVGVAGAGTGKTTTILARTKRILSEYATGRVLLVTFTRMAANDMQSRLYRQISDEDRRRVTVGTFHSVIGQLIRDHAVEIGLEPSFSVIDETSTTTMYQSIIERDKDLFDDFNHKIIGYPEPYDPRHSKFLKRDFNQIANGISTMVNSANPEELLTGKFSEDSIARMRKLMDKLPVDDDLVDLLYTVFKKSLAVGRDTNTVTYDHILFIGYLMTKSNILKDYADGLVHMIVDEYQDTNALQDAFVRYLGRNHLTLVGDVDQAIYEFRGGQSDLLVKHAEEGTVVNLTVNYRSYQPILDAANELINYNQSGKSIRKDLVAFRDMDEHFDGILEQDSFDDRTEAISIMDYIEYKVRNGVDPSDIAILVRSRMTINAINRELTKRKIPVNDTTSFADFMKSEVMRDTLNFIKIFTNPKDIYAFMSVLDKPKRGIGPKAMETLQHNAAAHGMSLITYLMSQHVETELKPALKKNVNEFMHVYTDLLDTKHQSMEFPEMVQYLLKNTGYLEWIDGFKNKKSQQTYKNNLNILDGMVNDFYEDYRKEHQDFTLFDIANAFTFEMTSSIKQEDAKGVTLATIHGSKGLEWKYVFVVGMEQENFPGTKMQDLADLESERRLMYVAITRAKNCLWVCFTKHIITMPDKSLTKSEFLSDMGDHQIKHL